MVEVKTYRVMGEVKKARASIPFAIELRAVKPEDALEKVYAELGSRHKARRFEIEVKRVEEVKSEQLTQPSER